MKKLVLVIVCFVIVATGCANKTSKEISNEQVKEDRMILDIKSEEAVPTNSQQTNLLVESDLSMDEIIAWNGILNKVVYFIPDFLDANSIETTKLIEAIFLYGVHEKGFNSGTVTADEMDTLCKELLNTNIKEHQNFELAQYEEGVYIAQGFSYNETRIAYVTDVTRFENNLILKVQQFTMGENDWINNGFRKLEEIISAIGNSQYTPTYLGEYIIVLDAKDTIEDYKEQLTIRTKIRVAN